MITKIGRWFFLYFIATLSWQNPTRYDSIEIYRQRQQDPWELIKTVPGNTTAYVNSSLKKNMRYCYKIQAKVGTSSTAFTNTICGIAR